MRAAHVDMIWQILECWRCHMMVVTWALVHCLMCTHSPSGAGAPSGIVRTYQALVPMLQLLNVNPEVAEAIT